MTSLATPEVEQHKTKRKRGRQPGAKSTARFTESNTVTEIVERYGKTYGVGNYNPVARIQADILSTYLKNAYTSGRTADGEDRDRVNSIIVATRFYAALFKIPVWKMIDLWLTRGMLGWMAENQHIIDACLDREQKANEAAQQMIKLYRETDEDRNKRFGEVIQRLNAEILSGGDPNSKFGPGKKRTAEMIASV